MPRIRRSGERQDEILAKMEEIQLQIEEQQSVIAEAIAAREATLVDLNAAVTKGLFPLWDSIEDIDSTSLNEVEVFFNTHGTRLTQVGWGGDLHGYVVTTLIHGRPGSVNVWPNSEGMQALVTDGGRSTAAGSD